MTALAWYLVEVGYKLNDQMKGTIVRMHDQFVIDGRNSLFKACGSKVRNLKAALQAFNAPVNQAIMSLSFVELAFGAETKFEVFSILYTFLTSRTNLENVTKSGERNVRSERQNEYSTFQSRDPGSTNI